MYRMLFALFIVVLSSQIGFTQTPQSLSSAGIVTPVPDDPLMDREWQIAVLSFQLSGIRPGTPLTVAVQEVRLLGGTEDGGLQSVPPTLFYLDPGLFVEIPAKEGQVAGPLRLTLVGQRRSGMAFGCTD